MTLRVSCLLEETRTTSTRGRRLVNSPQCQSSIDPLYCLCCVYGGSGVAAWRCLHRSISASARQHCAQRLSRYRPPVVSLQSRGSGLASPVQARFCWTPAVTAMLHRPLRWIALCRSCRMRDVAPSSAVRFQRHCDEGAVGGSRRVAGVIQADAAPVCGRAKRRRATLLRHKPTRSLSDGRRSSQQARAGAQPRRSRSNQTRLAPAHCATLGCGQLYVTAVTQRWISASIPQSLARHD